MPKKALTTVKPATPLAPPPPEWRPSDNCPHPAGGPPPHPVPKN